MSTAISSTPKQKHQLRSAVKNNRKESSAYLVVLLACGILSSLMYTAMNIFVPLDYPGYSSFSQVVSELSAVGAPTRQLWIVLSVFYLLFQAAFGWGILLSARSDNSLRITGWLVIVNAVTGAFWPPMHQREVLAAGGGTLTDTMHIVFTAVYGVFMMLTVLFAASAFKKRFRIYSALTILVMLAFGFLTSYYAPALQANEPTPWLGVWERIGIFAGMLWIAVFAIALLYRSRSFISPHEVMV
jgi:hypothetical protein